jgi:hypothetical protein
MTRITRSADCGNSPKNKAIEDMVLGLEGADLPEGVLTGATVWMRADGCSFEGAGEIAAARPTPPANISISRVTSHGKVGAVSGVTDGSAFAHILEYSAASMKTLALIDSFRKAANG